MRQEHLQDDDNPHFFWAVSEVILVLWALAGARTASQLMGQKILIVDDSNIIRSHCRIVLQKAGYEVIEAWDAAQARSALKQEEIAFLLCDLNIPGMSGLELIEAMRKVPKFAELPAAIISAESNPKLLERAKSAGVTHWLLKPYKTQELLELVAKNAGPPSR